nr:glutathione S-transferase U17-like [Tanacetum cinerariifolium]
MHHIFLSMAEKCELKLIGIDASPYVNRVQVVLKLKSIAYEYIQEHYPSKSELLLTLNPVHKKVPVLVHANKYPISESLVIIEYLDEIHPDAHQILPSAPLDRAESRFWVFYIDNTLWRLYEELRLAQGQEEKEEVKKRIFGAAKLLEGAYAKCSNGKTYFGGDD